MLLNNVHQPRRTFMANMNFDRSNAPVICDFCYMVTELLHLANHCVVLIFAWKQWQNEMEHLVLQGYLNKSS